jgi:sulfur carrier protein
VTVQVLVNGDARELATGTTVAGIVASLAGIPEGRGVAVALDGEVVPRGRWEQTKLTDGAQIEVVVAVQGG